MNIVELARRVEYLESNAEDTRKLAARIEEVEGKAQAAFHALQDQITEIKTQLKFVEEQTADAIKPRTYRATIHLIMFLTTPEALKQSTRNSGLPIGLVATTTVRAMQNLSCYLEFADKKDLTNNIIDMFRSHVSNMSQKEKEMCGFIDRHFGADEYLFLRALKRLAHLIWKYIKVTQVDLRSFQDAKNAGV